MGELYDTDVLEWSEHQARLLRQHAAGNPGSETPDWANIIGEVESVGRSQLSAVRSKIMQALEHFLKPEAWPLSHDAPKWRATARLFQIEAAEAFAPSMRERVDMAKLYRKALSLLPETVDGEPPLPVPPVCPITLDELLSDP